MKNNITELIQKEIDYFTIVITTIEKHQLDDNEGNYYWMGAVHAYEKIIEHLKALL